MASSHSISSHPVVSQYRQHHSAPYVWAESQRFHSCFINITPGVRNHSCNLYVVSWGSSWEVWLFKLLWLRKKVLLRDHCAASLCLSSWPERTTTTEPPKARLRIVFNQNTSATFLRTRAICRSEYNKLKNTYNWCHYSDCTISCVQ